MKKCLGILTYFVAGIVATVAICLIITNVAGALENMSRTARIEKTERLFAQEEAGTLTGITPFGFTDWTVATNRINRIGVRLVMVKAGANTLQVQAFGEDTLLAPGDTVNLYEFEYPDGGRTLVNKFLIARKKK